MYEKARDDEICTLESHKTCVCFTNLILAQNEALIQVCMKRVTNKNTETSRDGLRKTSGVQSFRDEVGREMCFLKNSAQHGAPGHSDSDIQIR